MSIMASSQLPSSSGPTTQLPQHVITFTTTPTRWVMQGATVDGQPFTLTTGVPGMTLDAPQTVLQSLVSSSCDNQVDKVTTSTPCVTASRSVTRIGSDPCNASIATLSMKELRLMGSSFLRSHASYHGIPNASRKLTLQVTAELSQHYHSVHKVHMIHDDYREGNLINIPSQDQVRSGVKIKRKNSHHATSLSPPQKVTVIPQLPQHPLPMPPLIQLQQKPVQSQLQIIPIKTNTKEASKSHIERELLLKQQPLIKSHPDQFWERAPRCRAEILVKTRSELSACGTSMLRPEAAAHKVHNASRKPKDVVVDELWQHYITCHQSEFITVLKLPNLAPGWVGNVEDDDEGTRCLFNYDFLIEVIKMESFLSTGVQALLSTSSPTIHDTRKSFRYVSQKNVFDEESIERDLLQHLDLGEDFKDLDGDWYLVTLKNLSPLFPECYKALTESKNMSKEFTSSMLKWISAPQIFQECIENFISGKLTSFETLLIVTPILERSLANVLATIQPKMKIPSLMRDLVKEPSLKKLWNCPVLDLIFHLLIGTPKGLNLRNLVWHGFICEGQISHGLPAALIILIYSISSHMPKEVSQCKPLVDLYQIELMHSRFDQKLLSKIHLIMLKMTESIKFVPQQKISIIKLALQRYLEGEEMKCLNILLPEWECFCRILFSTVNSCPQRLLTAEADTLYTTFDEMLSQNLPDQNLNQFPVVIGSNHMEFIFDLLVLPEGPRLRDKLSHGEVDLSFGDQQVKVRLRQSCQLIMASMQHLVGIMQEKECKDNNVISNYTSQFHPKSILRNDILNNLDTIVTIFDPKFWPKPSEFDYSSTDPPESMIEQNDDTDAFANQNKELVPDPNFESEISWLKGRLKSVKWKTIHRPKVEYEMINIYRQISRKIQLSLERIIPNLVSQLDQMTQHILKSRRRATYRRMLKTIPQILKLFLSIIHLILTDLENNDWMLESGIQHQTIIKNRKKFLKICENISENVSLSKNRWEESSVLVQESEKLFCLASNIRLQFLKEQSSSLDQGSK